MISEYWEDWILINGPETTLVSGKVRDLDQGAWEWADLVEKGGIAHLYRNSQRLPRVSEYRLSTNNALERSKTSPLGDACLVDDHASGSPRKQVSDADFTELSRKLARHLMMSHKKAGLSDEETTGRRSRAENCRPQQSLLAKVSPFLRKLRLDTDLPGRHFIDDSAPTSYVQPVLKALGHPPENAEWVWKALTDQVEQSMRARLPLEWGALSMLVQNSDNPEKRQGLPHDLLRRRITTDQARSVITDVVRRPRYFLAPDIPLRHKVSVKMHAGQCGANAIQRAEDSLKSWSNATSGLDDSPGNHAQVEAFTKDLVQRVDDVEYDLKNQGVAQEEMGARLWGNSIRLPPGEFPELPFPINRELITGAVAHAANECMIWFTEERFDADAELRDYGESNINTLSPSEDQPEGS